MHDAIKRYVRICMHTIEYNKPWLGLFRKLLKYYYDIKVDEVNGNYIIVVYKIVKRVCILNINMLLIRHVQCDYITYSYIRDMALYKCSLAKLSF